MLRLVSIGLSMALAFPLPQSTAADPPVDSGHRSVASKAPKAADMTVTWEGFDGVTKTDPKDAVYIVNGRRVGKGKEGFSRLLDEMRGLPLGAIVHVYPDNRLRFLILSGDSSSLTTDVVPDNVPFRANRPKSEDGLVRVLPPSKVPVSSEHARYRDVKKERQLDIRHFLRAPKGPDDLWMPEESLPDKVYYRSNEKRPGPWKKSKGKSKGVGSLYMGAKGSGHEYGGEEGSISLAVTKVKTPDPFTTPPVASRFALC